MTFNRRKKIAVATGMSAVAAMAVVGGTLAQFTDQDAADTQILTAGSVDIAATEGAGWNTNLANLAVGDTAVRDVTLTNSSTLPIKTIHLSADVVDSPAPGGWDFSDLVEVTVSRDGEVLASNVPLLSLETGGGIDLSFAGDAPAGADINLSFSYEIVGSGVTTGDRTDFVTNPDNAYQGGSTSVTYTIDAVQRDGKSQPTA